MQFSTLFQANRKRNASDCERCGWVGTAKKIHQPRSVEWKSGPSGSRKERFSKALPRAAGPRAAEGGQRRNRSDCAAPTALCFFSILSQRLPLQRAERASGRAGLTCGRAYGAWIELAPNSDCQSNSFSLSSASSLFQKAFSVSPCLRGRVSSHLRLSAQICGEEALLLLLAIPPPLNPFLCVSKIFSAPPR